MSGRLTWERSPSKSVFCFNGCIWACSCFTSIDALLSGGDDAFGVTNPVFVFELNGVNGFAAVVGALAVDIAD